MEFSFLSDVFAGVDFTLLRLPVLGQLILASLLGGSIGLERELSGKEAGLRTNMLICVGSTLLTILSLRVGVYTVYEGNVMADPSRLMAAIISGIGFLGAGTIIQARGNITGLTTAATLWVVAAIGIAIGAGAFVISVGSTIFVLATLIPLGRIEGRFLELPQHWIKAEVSNDLSPVNQLMSDLEELGFTVQSTDLKRKPDDRFEIVLEIRGREEILSKIPRLADGKPEIHSLNVVPETVNGT